MAAVVSSVADIKDDPPFESHLLGLPPELRNTIYRYALLSTYPVHITQTNYQQPALLRTCATIKQEASPIYYFENSFQIHIEKYDSTAAASWFQHAKEYKGPDESSQSLEAGYTGVRDCGGVANLLRWLRFTHQTAIPGLAVRDLTPSVRPFYAKLEALFHIAQTLKDVPWETVQVILRRQIDTFAHLNVDDIVKEREEDEEE